MKNLIIFVLCAFCVQSLEAVQPPDEGLKVLQQPNLYLQKGEADIDNFNSSSSGIPGNDPNGVDVGFPGATFSLAMEHLLLTLKDKIAKTHGPYLNADIAEGRQSIRNEIDIACNQQSRDYYPTDICKAILQHYTTDFKGTNIFDYRTLPPLLPKIGATLKIKLSDGTKNTVKSWLASLDYCFKHGCNLLQRCAPPMGPVTQGCEDSSSSKGYVPSFSDTPDKYRSNPDKLPKNSGLEYLSGLISSRCSWLKLGSDSTVKLCDRIREALKQEYAQEDILEDKVSRAAFESTVMLLAAFDRQKNGMGSLQEGIKGTNEARVPQVDLFGGLPTGSSQETSDKSEESVQALVRQIISKMTDMQGNS